MPTLGQLAAQALKEAKRKGPVSWEQVGVIIDLVHADSGCVGFKPSEDGKVDALTIYASYPRKMARIAAIKAITKAISEVMHTYRLTEFAAKQYLLERTKMFAETTAQWNVKDKQFIPYPATWYNHGNYSEDPENWKRVDLTTGIPDRTIHSEIINPLKLSQ